MNKDGAAQGTALCIAPVLPVAKEGTETGDCSRRKESRQTLTWGATSARCGTRWVSDQVAFRTSLKQSPDYFLRTWQNHLLSSGSRNGSQWAV